MASEYSSRCPTTVDCTDAASSLLPFSFLHESGTSCATIGSGRPSALCIVLRLNFKAHANGLARPQPEVTALTHEPRSAACASREGATACLSPRKELLHLHVKRVLSPEKCMVSCTHPLSTGKAFPAFAVSSPYYPCGALRTFNFPVI